MTGPPHSSKKRPVTTFYDLTDKTPLTPKKSRRKTTSVPKDSDSQTTKLIDFSSTTFLERFEANNKKIKKEIIESRVAKN